MGNVSELPGNLDCIFGLVRAKKVGVMVDAGGSELGLTPTRTSCGLWTVLRADPDDGRDAAVSLWCNWHDQIARSEEAVGLGLGCKGRGFHGGWQFERVVCSCLHMLNLLTCHMTFLGHLGASLGTLQGKVMVTEPSIASATKPF